MKGADAPAGSVATTSGRFYERNGRRYISVTNVLDHVISKPVLVPWASKLVAEFGKANPAADIKDWKRQPKIVKETSAQRGTDIHAYVEQYVLNPELAVNAIPPAHVAECVGFIEAWGRLGIEAISAEATVYSDKYRYAGTCDLFAVVDGEIWCIDVKTGKGVYPEHSLQTTAYARGDYIGLPDGSNVPVPAAVRTGLLHVQPTKTTLVETAFGESEWVAFQNAVGLAYWLVEDSKGALL